MADEQQILVFGIKGKEMGMDIRYVREILMPQEIHPIPNAPEFVEGVINLRGRIIVVFDLRKKFNIPSEIKKSHERIIVCRMEKIVIGLIVDNVSEVLPVPNANISRSHGAASQQFIGDYVSGIARLGDRVIVMVDIKKIISKEETEQIAHTTVPKSNKPD